jgi:MoaA/NifB/PqqE/SkfB family radical SAM enzyme
MFSFNKFKKYFRIAWKKIGNQLRTELFLRTGYFLPVPQKVYYTVSDKCNFQCQMCVQWARGKAESLASHVSEARMKELIDEMAAAGVSEFGISGGEPMIFREKVFSLLEYANQQGLYTHFVTNGSLLTKELMDKYESIGGGHISLSVDAIGNKHDELRGVPGAFAGVEKVLHNFREGNYQNINLKINSVLSDKNLDEVVAVAKLAIENKALFFLQPYEIYDFGHQYTPEEREANFSLWVKKANYPKLKNVLAEFIALKEKYPAAILNEKKHLEDMYDYFTAYIGKRKCYAGLDNLSINQEGKVTFCKFGELADLKTMSLKDFLKSDKRRNIVKASLACQHGCLIGCMYRPGLKEMLINGPKQFWRLIKS